jgi:hypothetical protein
VCDKEAIRPVECIQVSEGFALIQVGGPIPRNEHGLLIPPEGSALVIFDTDLNYDVRVDRVTNDELDLAFYAAMAGFLKQTKE